MPVYVFIRIKSSRDYQYYRKFNMSNSYSLTLSVPSAPLAIDTFKKSKKKTNSVATAATSRYLKLILCQIDTNYKTKYQNVLKT